MATTPGVQEATLTFVKLSIYLDLPWLFRFDPGQFSKFVKSSLHSRIERKMYIQHESNVYISEADVENGLVKKPRWGAEEGVAVYVLGHQQST